MLNSRLVRAKDAQLHFEVMAYLIQNFGAPPRPRVPSPLHKFRGLENRSLADHDTRSVFEWAGDQFQEITERCHMTDHKLNLVPAGEGLTPDQSAASQRLDALAAGQNPYYRSDTTPILYDPRDCPEPGHFVASTILQLAELRAAGFTPDAPLSSLQKRMVTLTAAVFNRQGFVLANLPHHVSTYLTSRDDRRAIPHRVVLNTLCFSTCLALRVQQQSEEQIIATYGVRMSKQFRRKIKHACRQIDSFASELSVLQMLASPRLSSSIRAQSCQQRA